MNWLRMVLDWSTHCCWVLLRWTSKSLVLMGWVSYWNLAGVFFGGNELCICVASYSHHIWTNGSWTFFNHFFIFFIHNFCKTFSSCKLSLDIIVIRCCVLFEREVIGWIGRFWNLYSSGLYCRNLVVIITSIVRVLISLVNSLPSNSSRGCCWGLHGCIISYLRFLLKRNLAPSILSSWFCWLGNIVAHGIIWIHIRNSVVTHFLNPHWVIVFIEWLGSPDWSSLSPFELILDLWQASSQIDVHGTYTFLLKHSTHLLLFNSLLLELSLNKFGFWVFIFRFALIVLVSLHFL